LFGLYENFPLNIKDKIIIQNINTIKNLQECIFKTFHYLNNRNFDLTNLLEYTELKCTVSFEFGIADGTSFIFLDKKELEKSIRFIEKNNYKKLDFFFVVRYHILKYSGKRVPLRFDYFILRFLFKKAIVELCIRHEKGTLRIPVDDLTNFILEQIDFKLNQKNLLPLLYGEFTRINIY
jgi:hypothetical protein